jgi:hypothetical protein
MSSEADEEEKVNDGGRRSYGRESGQEDDRSEREREREET